MLGGTTRINGMVYTRGYPGDFDARSEMGHKEWGFEKILKYFVKSERSLNQQTSNYRGVLGKGLLMKPSRTRN